MTANIEFLRVYDNQIVRDIVVEHRVASVHSPDGSVAVLTCGCGITLKSHAEPEAAVRRLWKTHAIHVAAALIDQP